MDRVVVVGAGQAGVQVADSLRAGGYDGAVTLLGEETALPYQRPPLSKDYLAPGGNPTPLPLRSEAYFEQNGIDFRPGVRVTAIDRASRAVSLDDGPTLSYTALVLATGATPRRLAVPGHDLSGVHELRTLADAERLRAELADGRSAVVVGAGFIGLEFAAVARKRGVAVTVLEAAERPLSRALSGTMARHLAEMHRAMGTGLRLGEGLSALVGQHGRVTAAVGTGGTEHPADLVVVGVGVRPRDDLARAAGLAVADGILVDARLRTTDPAVYAIGDCAAFPGVGGGRVRLESVQNATDQARHVAEMILGGAAGYAPVPWFWSHQGQLRLQIAGLSQPADTTVVSGDVRSGRFSVCCFRDGELVAVESLNRPADHTAARRVLSTRRLPTPEQVAKPGFSLKDHAKQLAASPDTRKRPTPMTTPPPPAMPLPAATAGWFDPAVMLRDPYATYDALRDTGPVVWVPAVGRYLATSFEACRAIEADQETYSASVSGSAALMARALGAQPMLRKDDPDHAVERGPINASMRPKHIRETWVPLFERNADTYLKSLTEKGPDDADLNTDYAAPLAAKNLIDMLGFQHVSPVDMRRWSHAFIAAFSNLTDDPETWRRSDAAAAEVDALLDELVPYYRKHPDSTMTSVWVNSGLPHEAVAANIKLTISGGMNEPQHMITNMVWALSRHPAQRDHVLADPGRWPAVFDEAVRWLSPIGMYPRETTRATVLEGVELPARAAVGVVVGAANRDPAAFERPHAFDINRPKRPHLGFGSGVHLCAGHWAARISIGEIAVPLLYSKLLGFRADERRQEEWNGWVFRGLTELPVTWDATSDSDH